MNILKALTGGLAQAASGAYQAHLTRKDQKEKFEHAIHLKKLEAVENGRINEAEWNSNSIKKAGWRPGFLTIILSAPLVLVFFPWFVPHITEGFTVLDSTPIWYRSAIAVMISSAFGYKSFADWQMKNKYE